MDSTSSSLKRPHEDDFPMASTKRMHKLPVTDTPLSEDTVCHHLSTSNMTTSEAEQHCKKQRRQDKLKNLLLAELQDVTHQSDTLHEVICPDAEGRTSTIMEDLGIQGWIDEREENVCLRDWPSKASGEHEYHRAFTEFINAIIDTFKARFPDAKSYWKERGIRFYTYDKAMKEEIGFAEPLKPDFLAASDTTGPFDSTPCSWLDAEVLGEMKASWKALVTQAATYARCAYAAANHRIFVPVFTFHRTNAIFRLLVFYRGGLLATPEVHLSKLDGLTRFVSVVVGMMSWADQTEAGYQRGQSHSHFRFNDKLYRIDAILCRRLGICGRVTQVYKVTLEPDQTPQRTGKAIQARSSKTLDPLSRPVSIVPKDSQQLNISSLPATFVLKCSHPLASWPKEEAIFAQVKGFIGIIDIFGAYDANNVCTPSDATFWDVFGEARAPEPKPEHRLHRHILFTTIGRPLSAARGPRELGYAILHTMIGHCALFTIGNYLHRDISSGNILLLPKEETRKIPPFLEGIVNSGHCIAVLIDGDVARTWGDARETGSRRSGTKPFLSHRVVTSWSMGTDMVHTPIDDLESFIWVLVFILLSKPSHRTQLEEYWLKRLVADELDSVFAAKSLITMSFVDSPSPSRPTSNYLATFGSLLHEWFKLAAIYTTRLGRPSLANEMKELSLEAYKKYIQTGLEYIPSLPLEWSTSTE